MDNDLFLRPGRGHRQQKLSGVGGNFRISRSGKSTSQVSHFLQENVEVLESFFEDPTLPGDLAALREKALARAYLHGACREYAADEIAAANRHALQAIQLDPACWADSGAPAHFFAGWAEYPVARDPVRFVLRDFQNLPQSAVQSMGGRGRGVGTAAAALAFRSYANKDLSKVGRWLLVGAFYRPAILRDAEVLSIGIDLGIRHCRLAPGDGQLIEGDGCAA